MKTIELLKMPEIVFSHSYETHKPFYNHFDRDKRFIEICYIYEGEMSIEKGEEVLVARKGDVLCIIHDEPTTVRAEKYHCHHTVGILTLWEFAEDASKGLYLPFITTASKETDEITKLIDEVIYSSYKFENSTTKIAEKLLGILCKIDEVNRKNHVPEYSVLAERAKKYIGKNIHRSITQREVAESLGVSTGYLCSVFKQAEGTTLIKYVNALKLKNIEAVMKKENVKLYEAAQIFGYQDANYVSYLYKKMFGKNITEHTDYSILKEPK